MIKVIKVHFKPFLQTILEGEQGEKINFISIDDIVNRLSSRNQ